MTAQKLRFKEFSEDYNVSTFQEAAIQIIDGDRGNNYPKSDDFYDNEYCLFLNAGNVTKSGFKFENTQFINKEKDALLRKGKLQKNDLVITTRGTVGNIAYFDESIPFENIRINSGMVIARSEIDVEPIYLNQFLKSDLFEKWLEKNVFGSAQPQLTVKLLNSISISYPSKDEQTKIASFLSTVDEKISQLTQKHELLSQYKQGMMQKLFSQQIRFKADDGSAFGEWEDLKICDLVRSLDAGVSVNSEDIKPTNDEYSVLKTSCISSGYFDENERKRVLLEEEINRLKEPVLDNSILMSRMNTPLLVGMNAYIEKAPKNTYLPDRLWQLKINADKVLTRWLAFYLGSENGLSQIRDLASGTSNSMKNIKKSDVLNLEIFVPSKEEQTKIANFLSAVDQKIEVVAQQIEQAKTWKKGLLQQMFV